MYLWVLMLPRRRKSVVVEHLNFLLVEARYVPNKQKLALVEPISKKVPQ